MKNVSFRLLERSPAVYHLLHFLHVRSTDHQTATKLNSSTLLAKFNSLKGLGSTPARQFSGEAQVLDIRPVPRLLMHFLMHHVEKQILSLSLCMEILFSIESQLSLTFYFYFLSVVSTPSFSVPCNNHSDQI